MERPHSGEAYGMPKPQVPETFVQSGDELITESLESLGNEALALYTAIVGPLPYPPSQLEQWIASFNALSPEERSKGTNDAHTTLEHRTAHTRVVSTRHGMQFAIHRAPDGEVTLAHA